MYFEIGKFVKSKFAGVSEYVGLIYKMKSSPVYTQNNATNLRQC